MNMMYENKKDRAGITLISLVVTIIVILILAGITISTIFGDNGIIKKAQELKNEQEKAQANEKNAINDLATQLNESIIDRVNAEEEALKNIYVFLYDDGTLAFSKNETPAQIEGKNILKEYGNIKGQVYTLKWIDNMLETNTPWFTDKSSITQVDFLDEIHPNNTAYWFLNCNQLTQIENIENLNTKDVTDMNSMFGYCEKLTDLDVSNFDTHNVTNMEGMFWECKSLISLDVSSFNTSKITSMYYMFFGMNSVKEINGLEKFDTSNVTNMAYVFYQCYDLVSLDLSNFNTSNVTIMPYMFEGCSELTSLDLSSFDTSNATDMQRMFRDDTNLKTIYVGTKWITEDANTYYMFAGCGTSTVTVK